MFSAILKTQWKWTRLAVLIAFIIGFTIPLLSMQLAAGEQNPVYGAAVLVRAMQQFGILYAFLAGGIGLVVAMLSWNSDHRGRHVYALSLPVSRAKYAGMRFGAGSLFLLAPTVGVLLGCLVSIATSFIPDGLHAYPMALTLRFLLASFVSYAIFFAISSSTTKASGVILGALAALVLVLVLLSMLGVGYDLMEQTARVLFGDYGLLSVFTGRWMLIDV